MHRRLIRAPLPRSKARRRRRVRRPSSQSVSRPAVRPTASARAAAAAAGGGGGGQQFQGNRSNGGGNVHGGRARRRRLRPNGGGRPPQGPGGGSDAAAHGRRRRSRRTARSSSSMSDLAGKHGLIVGVANKRSISWAIAQAAAAAGARLALTYPSERLEENVRELAATLDNPLVLPCDVAERSADRRARRGDRSRSSAASTSSCTARRSRRPSAEAIRSSKPRARASASRSTSAPTRSSALTRAVAPLMEKRGGGSVLTLTFIGSERVFTNYNVMGVAKAALESSVRIWRRDLGPQNIRVNAISAGPIKTLASAGIPGFSTHAAGLPRARAAAARRGDRARSPTRRCSCWATAAAASPAKC